MNFQLLAVKDCNCRSCLSEDFEHTHTSLLIHNRNFNNPDKGARREGTVAGAFRGQRRKRFVNRVFSSLCLSFHSVLDSAHCRHRGKRTMWKAALIVSLLLNVDLQVNGAVDKTREPVAGNSKPQKKAEATDATPPSDPASSGFSGNLLVVPMDGSHWVGMKALAQEMGRRGHRVTVVIPEVSIRLGPGKHYDTVTYPVPYDKDYIDSFMITNKDLMERSEQSFTETIRKRFSHMQKVAGFIHTAAESLLFNDSLISHLAQQVSANTEAGHIRINSIQFALYTEFVRHLLRLFVYYS